MNFKQIFRMNQRNLSLLIFGWMEKKKTEVIWGETEKKNNKPNRVVLCKMEKDYIEEMIEKYPTNTF